MKGVSNASGKKLDSLKVQWKKRNSLQFSVSHDGNFLAEYIGFLHGVGGENDQALFFEFVDGFPDVASVSRVHTGCLEAEER